MSAGSETQVSTGAPARGGCPGWMKLLLILSLAANVAVLGLVIGHSLRDDGRSGRGSGGFVESVVSMVPDARRDLARAHFAEADQQLRAVAEDRADRLQSVLAAIRAEPYDPAALEAALSDMFDRPGRRAVLRERLVTLLARLDPAEREVFAQRFAERLARR